MNNKRKIGITIISILLIVLIVHGVWASDDTRILAELDDTGKITLQKDAFDTYKNLYCIDENQKFEEIIEDRNVVYEAYAKAEIDGWDATFTNLKTRKRS